LKSTRIAKDFKYSEIVMMEKEKDGYVREQLQYPVKGPKNGIGLVCLFRMLHFINKKIDINILNETRPVENRDGFQLMVHDPFEVLSENAVHLFAVAQNTLFFKVIPEIMGFDDSLVDLTPEERNCWLPGERSLEFFKVYNRPNCEHECLAATTLKSCGCVQFYMVRNETTRICGAVDENCFREIEENFRKIAEDCKCYHPCERIKYDVKLLNSEWNE
jgi:Amiloride-sensitive sodium channel